MQSTGPSFPLPRNGASPTFRSHELPGRVDLWLARTASLRTCPESLSPEELAACSAFHREKDQRRALLARSLLRETLSRYAPVPPRAWRFALGPHGKPEIAAPAAPRLRFNLSHTADLVACAVTLGDEIGVDVEEWTRPCEALELGERVFTPEENQALLALSPGARQRRFFELWTLKEAYLKARGLGFALDPRCVGFDLEDQGRVTARFAPEARECSAEWCFALLETVPGHVLALATRSSERPVRIRTFLAAAGQTRVEELEPRVYARSRARTGLAGIPLSCS